MYMYIYIFIYITDIARQAARDSSGDCSASTRTDVSTGGASPQDDDTET